MNLRKESLNDILGISGDAKRLQDDGNGWLWNSLSRKKDDDDGGHRWARTLDPCSSLHRSRSLPCLGAKAQDLSMIEMEAERPGNVLKSRLRPLGSMSNPDRNRGTECQHGDVESSWGSNHCTEGLRFESSDVMEGEGTPLCRGDEEGQSEVASRERVYLEKRWRRKMMARLRLHADLPPPLPSLSSNGHPSFFLRAERCNGRIRLARVRIDHHGVFLANRENGRLTLLVEEPCEPCVTENESSHAEGETLEEEEEEKEEEEEEWNTIVLDRHEFQNRNVAGEPIENSDLNKAPEGIVKPQPNSEKEVTANPHEYCSSHTQASRDASEIASDVVAVNNLLLVGHPEAALGSEDQFTDSAAVTENRQLSPSLWRCNDREERTEFWNNRCVTTT